MVNCLSTEVPRHSTGSNYGHYVIKSIHGEATCGQTGGGALLQFACIHTRKLGLIAADTRLQTWNLARNARGSR